MRSGQVTVTSQCQSQFRVAANLSKTVRVIFHLSLCHTDWSPVYSRAGVAVQWTAFTDLCLPILDFHAPLQRIKLHNPSAPPVSDSTLQLMARRRGLLTRDGGTPAFLDLDKKVKSAIRTDVKHDITRRVNEQGPTTIFRNIRQVIEGKKSSPRAVPEATPDEQNEYFVGVGPRVAGEVRSRGEPLQLPCRLPRVGACAFTVEPVSLDFFRSILFSMKNSGACGSDSICIRILKLCFDVIGHVLLYINTCLTTHEYPASWKHSIVHPIHKSGSLSETSNFRPISIVPAFPKVVEQLFSGNFTYAWPATTFFPHPSTVFVQTIPPKLRFSPYPTISFPPSTARTSLSSVCLICQNVLT